MTPGQRSIVGAQACLDRMEAGVGDFLKQLDTATLFDLVDFLAEGDDTRATWAMIKHGPEYVQQLASYATLLALTREQIRRAEELYGTPNGEKTDGR